MKKDIKGATGNTRKISVLPAPTVVSKATPRSAEGYDFEEFVVVSVQTGEEVARYVFDGRSVPRSGDWVQLYQSFADQIASDPQQSLESRCLWLVVAKAGFGNMVRINLAETAREWRANRVSISQAMSRLVKRGLIERARGGSFRLNPNFCWKGSSELRSRMRAKWSHDHEGAPSVKGEKRA